VESISGSLDTFRDDLGDLFDGFSSAKDLICYLGYYQLGVNGKELARYFSMSRPSVSQAIKRSEKFAKENDIKLLS